MSKLEVLARYTEVPKKKKRRTNPGSSSSVTIVEELDSQYALDSVEERWDKDLKEDQPVVEELRGGYNRKGNWEVLGAPEEDPSPPRRRRAEDPSPPRRPTREEDPSPPRRRRAEDPSPPRRPTREENDAYPVMFSSAGSADSFTSRGKVSRFSSTVSGHAAGLQSGSEFGEREREYKVIRDSELSKADPSLSGAQSSTVYRDKTGKKLDILNEFVRQQALKETKVNFYETSRII